VPYDDVTLWDRRVPTHTFFLARDPDDFLIWKVIWAPRTINRRRMTYHHVFRGNRRVPADMLLLPRLLNLPRVVTFATGLLGASLQIRLADNHITTWSWLPFANSVFTLESIFTVGIRR
jgi:hypothetical protein